MEIPVRRIRIPSFVTFVADTFPWNFQLHNLFRSWRSTMSIRLFSSRHGRVSTTCVAGFLDVYMPSLVKASVFDSAFTVGKWRWRYTRDQLWYLRGRSYLIDAEVFWYYAR
jgi:hypothetical protein